MTGSSKLRIILAAFLSALMGSYVCAEVGVQVDGSTEFQSLSVTTKQVGQHVEHWSRTSTLPSSQLLNSDGDAAGDHLPVTVVTSSVVGEVTTASNDMAYVVWSSSDGQDYDVVYSSFFRGSWTPRRTISSPNQHDDLDPSLAAFKGQLFLVWWANEPIPKIYYSQYKGGHWTLPEVVSNPLVASRFPTVRINTRNEVVISYTSYNAGKKTDNTLIREDCDP